MSQKSKRQKEKTEVIIMYVFNSAIIGMFLVVLSFIYVELTNIKKELVLLNKKEWQVVVQREVNHLHYDVKQGFGASLYLCEGTKQVETVDEKGKVVQPKAELD
jgi:hypothetical protein